MDISARIHLIFDSYHDICSVNQYDKVLETLLPLFDTLGYQSTFITGIPLPNQPISQLIIYNDWHSKKQVNNKAYEKDIVIQKAIDWPTAFVLKKEFHETSIFGRKGCENNSDHGVLVCPIHSVFAYQGVVIQSFKKSSLPSCPDAPQAISYRERTAYSMLLNYAFYRMHELSPEAFTRKGDLTRREKDVLSVSALGNTSLETANKLNIKERTVISHLQNATQKLGATNRTECVLQAIQYRQIGPGAGLGFYQIENEIYSDHPEVLESK